MRGDERVEDEYDREGDPTIGGAAACDSSWDGVLFGIPTGALLGVLAFAGVSIIQGVTEGLDCRGKLCPSKKGLLVFTGGGAVVGGVGGYVLDKRECHERE